MAKRFELKRRCENGFSGRQWTGNAKPAPPGTDTRCNKSFVLYATDFSLQLLTQ